MFVTEGFSAFTFKQDRSDPSKPYITKTELGTTRDTKFKTLDEFVDAIGLDIKLQPDPVLYAKMLRKNATLERNPLDRIPFTVDDVWYSDDVNSQGVNEGMIEIEDKVDPSININNDDSHMISSNDLILSKYSKILIPTKHTKVLRAGIRTNKLEL